MDGDGEECKSAKDGGAGSLMVEICGEEGDGRGREEMVVGSRAAGIGGGGMSVESEKNIENVKRAKDRTVGVCTHLEERDQHPYVRPRPHPSYSPSSRCCSHWEKRTMSSGTLQQDTGSSCAALAASFPRQNRIREVEVSGDAKGCRSSRVVEAERRTRLKEPQVS